MKPDSGKGRDKDRLAAKKAKKKEAKEARKAAAAHDGVDVVALQRDVKSLRGSNRRIAFAALAKADAELATAFVRGLCKDAQGNNLQELGALLLSRAHLEGGAHIVDDVLDGRYGDVNVFEHASGAVDDALLRLEVSRPLLAPAAVVRRMASLGVVPLAEPHRRPGANRVWMALASIVDDDRFDDAEFAGFKAAAVDALLLLAPAALWMRRERVPIARAAAAGLASEMLVDDKDAVDAFAAAVAALPAGERNAVLMAAKLPRSALRLPPPQRLSLLRAVFLLDHLDANTAHAIASELAKLKIPAADELVLTRPDANVASTIDIISRFDAAEAWSIVEPFWTRSRELRDLWCGSPHAGHPDVLDAALPFVVDDPIGAMALLVRSRHPRAAQEILHILEQARSPRAELLLAGVLLPRLAPGVRANPPNLKALLTLTDGGPRGDIAVDALRIFRPVAGVDVVAAIDDAVERLTR